MPDPGDEIGTEQVDSRQTRGSAATGRWFLLAVALGTTLAPLNSTMIAVALPAIQADFGVSVTETTLLVTIYLAAMAAGQPIGGRLGDQFGRRRVYLAGLIWFGVASAGCAFAPDMPLLIFFRTQQALAGALSFPNGAAMIREGTPYERRGAAFGMIGLATGVAAAAGPPIGGLLVHQAGWQAIFWVNVPIVALALILGYRELPRRQTIPALRPPFDIGGSALLALCLAGVVVIPATIRLHHPSWAILAGAVSLIFGILFVWWELRQKAPVVDIRLFAKQNFAAACASVCLSNLVMYTTLLALPLYLQRVRGYDEQVTGLTLVALSAFSGLWGPIGGRVTDRRGRRLPAVLGAITLLAGVSILAGVVRGDLLWPVIIALGFMGLGLGVSGAPVQIAAIEAAPMSKLGAAAGVFSTSRYLGSVAGTTVLALVFVEKPGPGDAGMFAALFAGLAVVAFAGILVNNRLGVASSK